LSSTSASDRFLPPDPRVEEPYRLTPRIAVRVGMLGLGAVGLFAVLFFRLWALQVLTGTHYLREAQNNQIRSVRIEAQRGLILDRSGQPLVTNVPGTVVRIWPANLPEGWRDRTRELRRLARLLRVPVRQIQHSIAERAGDALTPVLVKANVHDDKVNYIYEHRDSFRGVDIHETFLRNYPHRALAAHVLGQVGEISPAQLKEPRYRKADYRPGDRIGQGGVEGVYDRYLRGRPGLATLRMDALGRPLGELTPRLKPQSGQTLRLTLDLDLQRAAERALRYGISLAHGQDCYGCWSSNGGAIVAMDPRNGGILALASNPTYNPELFTGRVDPKKLTAAGLTPATAKKANYPALDRAIAGLYPAGSTFKPITALAAMQEHLISPYQTLDCTGSYTVNQHTFFNWNRDISEPMTLPTALETSCDTYFYRLGFSFYQLPADRGHPLQAWARRFGIGAKTGLDLPGEAEGLLPTPEWREAAFTKKTDPCCWRVDRLWKPGDSIQLAIGQKDLQLTPLQLTRAYSVIANGGKAVVPHLAEDVEQSPGDGHVPVVLRRFSPPAPRPIGLDPYALSIVREGLYLATHGAGGTSTSVFGAFPVPIAGKTGTAEKALTLPGSSTPTLVDQSWWCGYGPADSPTIAVCALIENGGHGGTAAAPAALKVFEEYFGKKGGFSLPGLSD
jgi:penicillin-binding protein 2